MRPRVLISVLLFTLVALTGASALDSPRPVLVLDAQDRPWAAWVEHHGATTVPRVARWEGGTWTRLDPGTSALQGNVASVSLAVGPEAVWAAWGEDGAPGRLQVEKWTGTAWEEPGPGPHQPAGAFAERPQVRVDSRGRPWVLWSSITPGGRVEEVSLAYREANAWTLFGTLAPNLDASPRIRDLVLGPGDQPFLAFGEKRPRQGFQTFAGPWDGLTPPGLGGSLNIDLRDDSWFPSLAVNPQGVPTVAFIEVAGHFKIVVKRWTGTRWEVLGTPGSLGARNPKVGLAANGSPVVAAIERFVGITARLRTNSGWADLGTVISTPGAFVDTLDLAMDSQGYPWLIWAEDDARGQRLGMAHWDGLRWQPLAPPPFLPD